MGYYNLIANLLEICKKCHPYFLIYFANKMQPNDIKQLIETGLDNALAYVEGDGAHFTAAVVSSLFTGKNRIEKQQLVYNTVREQLLDGSLHALSISTFTPEEWQKLQKELNSEE